MGMTGKYPDVLSCYCPLQKNEGGGERACVGISWIFGHFKGFLKGKKVGVNTAEMYLFSTTK